MGELRNMRVLFDDSQINNPDNPLIWHVVREESSKKDTFFVDPLSKLSTSVDTNSTRALSSFDLKEINNANDGGIKNQDYLDYFDVLLKTCADNEEVLRDT